MSRTYTITLTAEQAGAVAAACELAGRLGMCQIADALDALPHDWKAKDRTEKYCAARDALEDAERAIKPLFGLGFTASFGIAHDRVPERAKRAWDVCKVIRHRLAWDRAYDEGVVKPGDPRKWPEMMQVDYDEARCVSGEALPEIEIAGP